MAMEDLARSTGSPGEAMLEERDVRGIFALRARDWPIKAIARELSVAPNTVHFWLRRGEDAPRPAMGRPRVLDDWLPWVQARFREGVRNGDVLQQELADRGVQVSLRTVERATTELRREALCQEKATLRSETEPGQQLQIDFGERWLEVADERIHGSTHERPSVRFRMEKPALASLEGVTPYRVVRCLDHRVALDGRVQVETNHYSVPWELAGQSVGLQIKGEDLEIVWREKVIARHRLHPGHHQNIVDSAHVEGLMRRTYRTKETEDIQRPLEAYAQAAGGEAWS